MTGEASSRRAVVLGIRPNLVQFGLLVLVNAFVGGMVGVERTVLPLLARREFGIASSSAMLSFLVGFGVVKASANLAAGRLADRVGRKRLLVAGWAIGLPVPLLLVWAPSWAWVTVANLLLGVNQGLCWSTTVVMKMDLAGPRRRGLAMGLNEFAGYGAVALVAWLTGYLAGTYGLRPVPFEVGLLLALLGLAVSAGFVRDTGAYVQEEARLHPLPPRPSLRFAEVVARVSWRDPTLAACSQAGLVNNLNDAMAWGLLPLVFAAGGLEVQRIGLLTATYPAVWGIAQLAAGALSDRWGRKWMIAGGMWVQAAAIGLVAVGPLWESPKVRFAWWEAAAVLLGLGTALVYPTLLAAVSDAASPLWRASAVGVYRLWRDLGYAVGGVTVGVAVDLLGTSWAIILVAALTFLSGCVVAVRMGSSAREGTIVSVPA